MLADCMLVSPSSPPFFAQLPLLSQTISSLMGSGADNAKCWCYLICSSLYLKYATGAAREGRVEGWMDGLGTCNHASSGQAKKQRQSVGQLVMLILAIFVPSDLQIKTNSR